MQINKGPPRRAALMLLEQVVFSPFWLGTSPLFQRRFVPG